jgi:Phage Mu protein F like protein
VPRLLLAHEMLTALAQQGRTLVTDVVLSEQQVEALRRIVDAALDALTMQAMAQAPELIDAVLSLGLSAPQTGKLLGALVALTGRQQAMLVHQMQAQLSEEGIAQTQIVHTTLARANVMAQLRADTIARTETIRAVEAGKQAAWSAMAEAGALPVGFRRVWITAQDERVCPICAPIPDAYPDGVGLHAPFNTSVGPVLSPPAHPLCRCYIEEILL